MNVTARGAAAYALGGVAAAASVLVLGLGLLHALARVPASSLMILSGALLLAAGVVTTPAGRRRAAALTGRRLAGRQWAALAVALVAASVAAFGALFLVSA